jgi:hypothetical protein
VSSDQTEQVTDSRNTQGLADSLSELAEQQDVPPDEFAEMLEDKSAMDLMRDLMT